ncbi:MAG: transcription antitermination factor NusB [Dehalococcoidia bacterium]
MAGTRRKGRVAALQTLYESDCAHHDPEESLSRLAEDYALPESSVSFARELVNGVLQNKGQIDALIHEHAPSWPVEQLSAIDRNILRLAIFEISIDNRVPTKAAINEAIELAKSFGSYNSSRFINGVLGSISRLQAQENS